MNIHFKLEKGLAGPIYLSLATEIARMIDTDELRAGQALPSSRELAAQLGLSRDTVVNAYRELNRLAYTCGDSPKGTYVIERHHRISSPVEEIKLNNELLSAFGKQMIGEMFRHSSSASFAGLNYGAVPRSALPMRKWGSIMQELCKPETFRKLEYKPDVLGRSELRKAIAGYLYRTKGIECDWRQVAVFSISSGLINVVCKLLLEPEATVAVEEPGYGAIKNIAKTLGLSLLPVHLDDQGLTVKTLGSHKGPISMVYVTAGHHDPTGTIMSMERRAELLSWAQKKGVWIVDDDYDGHFYYDSDPPKTLWSLNPEANVIYSSTFWQILYPLTTIGYAVFPEKLIPAIVAARELQTECLADPMAQLVLSKLLDEGHLENHIRRTKRIFSKRRVAIIYELKRQFGSDIEIRKESAGCHFTIYFRRWSESEVIAAALESDLPIVPTSAYYLVDSRDGEYLFNFSLYPEEIAAAKLTAFVRALRVAETSRK